MQRILRRTAGLPENDADWPSSWKSSGVSVKQKPDGGWSMKLQLGKTEGSDQTPIVNPTKQVEEFK